MRRVLGLVAAAVVAVALVLAGGSAAHGDGSTAPHVTLIGDSVADALPADGAAVRILGQGVDLGLEVAPCRRLTGSSCPPNPPTAIDVITSKGAKIGPTVVIAVGYNDFEDQYAGEIEQILDALKQANVQHVFWLTLRAVRHPYLTMNDDIAAAAARHPELAIVDWNMYARSHPEWFQDDGLHLLDPGSEAMATLIHQKLLDAEIAIPPVMVATKTLPLAHARNPYSVHLTARGGESPYAWSLAGRLPTGLHLRSTGLLSGTPRRPTGTFSFTVKVKDAIGQTGTRTLVLRLR